ncbi:MAG: nonstructural protein [Microvirus sp.]|nr:MAG: nonstructural protein [Microvirus sp.]
MNVEIFAIMDIKVGAYMQPWFSATKASAIRSFENVCKDQSTTLGQYPADFQLFALGKFDDQTGLFETHTPLILCSGASNVA